MKPEYHEGPKARETFDKGMANSFRLQRKPRKRSPSQSVNVRRPARTSVALAASLPFIRVS
jgi:hypothetical protein